MSTELASPSLPGKLAIVSSWMASALWAMLCSRFCPSPISLNTFVHLSILAPFTFPPLHSHQSLRYSLSVIVFPCGKTYIDQWIKLSMSQLPCKSLWWASTQSMTLFMPFFNILHAYALWGYSIIPPLLWIRIPQTSPCLHPYPTTISGFPMFVCDLLWPPLLWINLRLMTTSYDHLLFNCWVQCISIVMSYIRPFTILSNSHT